MGVGFRWMSKEIRQLVFYSPKQAIQCVVNTAHSNRKKDCILHINLNSGLSRKNQSISGRAILPYNNQGNPDIVVVSDTLKESEIKVAKVSVITVDQLQDRVQNEQFSVDVVFTTPEYIQRIIPVAPILGKMGLMPSTKNGTVSKELDKAIQTYLQPTVSFESLDGSPIECPLGNIDRPVEELSSNFKAFFEGLVKAKPDSLSSLLRSAYVKSENGSQYFIDKKFLFPGDAFFNENYANKKLVIPTRHEKGEKLAHKVENAIISDVADQDEEEKEKMVKLATQLTEEEAEPW